MLEKNKIYQGHTPDVLKSFPDDSIDCVITSPPYWSLRDYQLEPQIWDDGWKGQLGLEPTFELYLKHLMQIFGEVKRILKPTGTCFVNLGDSYASGDGSSRHIGYQDPKYKNGRAGDFIEPSAYPQGNVQPKSLCAIPERFKIMMIDSGWICRNTIIWYKRNCMPSSANDRFTVDYEYVHFFVKNPKYWFEQQFEPSIYPNDNRKARVNPLTAKDHKSGGNKIAKGDKLYPNRNKRCVWDVTTKGFSDAHFAVFPEALVEPMLRSGCPVDGIVCDIFGGSGTVAKVAKKLKRNWILIELNPEYIKMANKRIKHVQQDLFV